MDQERGIEPRDAIEAEKTTRFTTSASIGSLRFITVIRFSGLKFPAARYEFQPLGRDHGSRPACSLAAEILRIC